MLWSLFAFFPGTFLQATSDKTGSVGFTQTGGTAAARGVANNLSNGKTGYSLFYQWGRKDAFRSAEYTTAPVEGTTLVFKKESVTVGITIQTPTIIYYNNRIQYTPYYYNAWNATYTELAGTSREDIDGLEKVVKTVYDPCPVGYTVPPANTFTVFTKDNTTVDGASRYYNINGKKLYFQYTGRRYFETGALFAVGEIGSYWMAVLGGGDGRLMSVEATAVTPVNASSNGVVKTSGNVIRPVREN